jgi:Lar family restriction alleviation protein
MAVSMRIDTRGAPRLLLDAAQPFFRDEQRRMILGTPHPAACPFCDRHEDLVVVRGLSVLDSAPLYHVTCECCGAEGPAARSRRAAAVLWNAIGVTAENRYHRLLCGPGEA